MTEKVSKLMTHPPLGRRQRKALAVRQALFDAGLAAFERQPIGLVSVLDITETADVAKGVFYLQFRSKDEYLLALWAEVQDRFLDIARNAALESSSRSARIEAIVDALIAFSRQSPAATRFWLRMASFFPDEIGEPGHLVRIRQAYIQQLAGVIAGKTSDMLTQQDLYKAQALDSLGWAVIQSEQHSGEPVFGVRKLLQAIRSATSVR